MKTKLFYKIFAFTFGMMLLITVLAHVLIFMIAPSENVLITSTTVTNEDVLAFSEVDMPQLITQTILKSFPDRKSTRLNSSHNPSSRMPSSA